MTVEEADELAEKWLRGHGYNTWLDGTWHFEGHEADVAEVLAEYIEDSTVDDAPDESMEVVDCWFETEGDVPGGSAEVSRKAGGGRKHGCYEKRAF